MGKQATKVLKRRAQEIFKTLEGKFTKEFEHNKQSLKETGIFDYSKTDRNLAAGVITRIVKAQQKTE